MLLLLKRREIRAHTFLKMHWACVDIFMYFCLYIEVAFSFYNSCRRSRFDAVVAVRRLQYVTHSHHVSVFIYPSKSIVIATHFEA